MSAEIGHSYEFGNFRLDSREKTLVCDGKPLALTPKVFETLQIFLEHPGCLLPKNELIHKLWQDRFVEDSNLTFNIKMLRKALQDNPRAPRFIETVPRRGYRFIAEVRACARPATGKEEVNPSPDAEVAQVVRAEPGLTRNRKPYILFAAVSVSVLLASVLALWVGGSRIKASTASAPVLSAPFRSENFSTSGNVGNAVLSPDGKFAAYSSQSGGKTSIWLRQLESSENIQIVAPSDEYVIGGMTFSHDGQTLYFMRKPLDEKLASAIYRVNSFGGIPAKILDRTEGPSSLSPDDKQISFVRCEYTDDDFCSLMVADSDGRNERKLVTRPRPIRISANQFSPDGKSLAFAVGQSWNGGSDFRLLRVDLQSGTESEITPQRFFNIKGLHWLPGADGLLFTANENIAQNAKIWKVTISTGEAVPATNDAADYAKLSLDKNAQRLIATHISDSFQVYLAALNAAQPLSLTAGLSFDFTPDGKIVYQTSQRDLWIINRDGSGQRQLTNNSFNDFYPRVSPDGRFVYFTSNRTGSNQVWRMNIDGSNQIQITEKEGGYPCFVSPDGKWVYFESGLHQTLWRVAAGGGGETQISKRRIYSAAFTPDGSLMACFIREGKLQKIAVISVADQKLVKLLDYADGRSSPVRISWSANHTLNFITRSEMKNSLWQQTLDEERPRFIADLGTEQIAEFALSPDGNGYAFSRGMWLHNAVLIDGLK